MVATEAADGRSGEEAPPAALAADQIDDDRVELHPDDVLTVQVVHALGKKARLPAERGG